MDTFVCEILVASYPMIEEIALPFDSELSGVEAFPILDDFFHLIACFPIEWNEGVEVVGHEENDGSVPCLPLVLKMEGLEDPRRMSPLL